MARSSAHLETQAVLSVADPARLNVLQITDIHFFCTLRKPERDARTVEELPRLVELTKPDLILATGDIWHENRDGRAEEFMAFTADTFGTLGIPWAFTWGNHDFANDYAKAHDFLTEAPYSLYRGGPGQGNYTIEVRDAQQHPVWEFICLNSSMYGIEAAQRAWLRGLGERRAGTRSAPNAFAVFHIPLRQYNDIWESGAASGVKLEAVAKRNEDGSTLALLKGFGAVRACVCGHDHVNDYAGVANGVDLIYGRATGHGGYGRRLVPKGAKLFTINTESGRYAWESILPDGNRWQPEPGRQIDKRIDTPWSQREGA